MEPVRYKLIEFFIIFIVLPVSFAIPYPVILKFILGIIGFVYVIYVLLKIENKLYTIKITNQSKGLFITTSKNISLSVNQTNTEVNMAIINNLIPVSVQKCFQFKFGAILNLLFSIFSNT